MISSIFSIWFNVNFYRVLSKNYMVFLNCCSFLEKFYLRIHENVLEISLIKQLRPELQLIIIITKNCFHEMLFNHLVQLGKEIRIKYQFLQGITCNTRYFWILRKPQNNKEIHVILECFRKPFQNIYYFFKTCYRQCPLHEKQRYES